MLSSPPRSNRWASVQCKKERKPTVCSTVPKIRRPKPTGMILPRSTDSTAEESGFSETALLFDFVEIARG